MVQEAQLAKRRTLKDWLVFVLKVALWLVIGYSFTKDCYQGSPWMGQIAYGLNVFLAGSILISIARFIFIYLYRRRHMKNDRVRGNYVLGINRFATILNVVFIVLGLMLIFGINPKEFLTSITIVAMAIALLFRDYITNMISGLLLMFSDQFTIGDHIKIGDNQGKIVDITLANIMVRNEDDDVVLIPNNTAFTTNIINQSLQNSRKLSIEFQIPLAYAYDQQELEERLVGVLQKHKGSVVENTFQLKVSGLDKESVHYKLQFSTNTKDSNRRKHIRNDLFREMISYEAEQAAKVARLR